MISSTSAPGGATFFITRANARSFDVSSVAALNAILIVYGFHPMPITNSTESARFGRGESAGKPAELIIIYNSGTATCAGTNWQRAAQLLDRFARQSARLAPVQLPLL